MALALGLAVGLLAYVLYARAWRGPVGLQPDVVAWWRAAQLWRAGVDPYSVPVRTAAWPWDEPLYHPAPAFLAAWPLARASLPAAGAIQTGASVALLAWALTRDGFWRLWALAHPGLVMAVKAGQWSPLLTAAALVPAAGWALACKPTLGIACWAYRPTWRATLLAAALGVVSLVLVPGWPAEWLARRQTLGFHPAPLVMPLGALCAVAVLRWRQREARLLLALAAVPQLLFFADQLPLALAARTRGEQTFLAACGLGAWILWWTSLAPGALYVRSAAPYVLAGTYLPALVCVLRRPNAGAVPAWVERAVVRARVPGWRRGSRVAPSEARGAGRA